MNRFLLALGLGGVLLTSSAEADPPPARPAPVKLLLIGSGPDGHPAQTHEYMAGLKIVAKCLKDVPGLEITTVRADEPWREGPELIARADGVVLFLSEGARWMNHDPKRRQALATLAKHGGGISVLHWAMGTKDAKYIEGCLQLLGGCHGGPDRKYKVLETQAAVADSKHPLMAGIKDFRVHDEFYYRLKFIKADRGIHPLLRVTIDGQQETVAWCWERPDHGRSFGFSGLHFHENWRLPAYRRLVAQGVLWTLKKPIPRDGLPVKVTDDDLKLPEKTQEKSADPLPPGARLRLGTPRLRHAGPVGPVVFSPDGRTLLAGMADTTVLLWDLVGGRSRERLTDAELEHAWTDLGGDARTAYRAAQRLASAAEQSIPWLSAKLRPVPPPDAGKVARLLVELDDAAFAVRERAERELDKLGGVAEPALREELTKRPSLEVRRRIEGLLARLDTPASLSADALREVRAVMALEWAATPPARRLLQTLAKGAAGARLTREAKAASGRLTKRIASAP